MYIFIQFFARQHERDYSLVSCQNSFTATSRLHPRAGLTLPRCQDPRAPKRERETSGNPLQRPAAAHRGVHGWAGPGLLEARPRPLWGEFGPYNQVRLINELGLDEVAESLKHGPARIYFTLS